MRLPIDEFGERNCLRLDFDVFTFYIGMFCNPLCIDGHAHEDFLSYVVYCETAEVLVDPGRSSFSVGSASSVVAQSHNGLSDVEESLSHLRRFFSNRRLRSEPRKRGGELTPARGVRLWARNTLTGLYRQLSLEQTERGVSVEETLHHPSRPIKAHFGHLLPDLTPTLSGNKVFLPGAGCTIIYDTPAERASLLPSVRSPSYGEERPCKRLQVEVDSGQERTVTIRWTISRI